MTPPRGSPASSPENSVGQCTSYEVNHCDGRVPGRELRPDLVAFEAHIGCLGRLDGGQRTAGMATGTRRASVGLASVVEIEEAHMITIVSGFQRCGSSLLCQMLAAGGLHVFHDPGSGYPSFETQHQE